MRATAATQRAQALCRCKRSSTVAAQSGAVVDRSRHRRGPRCIEERRGARALSSALCTTSRARSSRVSQRRCACKPPLCGTSTRASRRDAAGGGAAACAGWFSSRVRQFRPVRATRRCVALVPRGVHKRRHGVAALLRHGGSEGPRHPFKFWSVRWSCAAAFARTQWYRRPRYASMDNADRGSSSDVQLLGEYHRIHPVLRVCVVAKHGANAAGAGCMAPLLVDRHGAWRASAARSLQLYRAEHPSLRPSLRALPTPLAVRGIRVLTPHALNVLAPMRTLRPYSHMCAWAGARLVGHNARRTPGVPRLRIDRVLAGCLVSPTHRRAQSCGPDGSLHSGNDGRAACAGHRVRPATKPQVLTRTGTPIPAGRGAQSCC